MSSTEDVIHCVRSTQKIKVLKRLVRSQKRMIRCLVSQQASHNLLECIRVRRLEGQLKEAQQALNLKQPGTEPSPWPFIIIGSIGVLLLLCFAMYRAGV